MDLDLIGVTTSSISAIQPTRPRSGGSEGQGRRPQSRSGGVTASDRGRPVRPNGEAILRHPPRTSWAAPAATMAPATRSSRGVSLQGGGGDPRHSLPLVALMPQWRQDHPNNRPPTWATVISTVGQE